MLLVIEDRTFEILRELGGSRNSKVFLVKDCSDSRKVVLKFLTSSTLFFDELARYYTLDGHPGICRLLYNYPPLTAGGRNHFAHPGVAQALDLQISEMDSHDQGLLSDTGALVLEYVEGPSLQDYLRELPSDEARLPVLCELADHIVKIHGQDEFHGELIPNNVLWDRRGETVKILDMGFIQPDKDHKVPPHSPEHTTYCPRNVDAAADTYMFAANFLTTLSKPVPELKSLIERAASYQPHRRPKMTRLHAALKRASGKEVAVPSPFSRYWRRMLAAGLFVTFSAVGVSYLRDQNSIPNADQLTADQQIQALVERRIEATGSWFSDPQIQQSILREIGSKINQIKRAQGAEPIILTGEDIDKPSAVFNFQSMPLLLTENQILAVGDSLILDGIPGYVENLNSRRLEVRLDNDDRRTYSFQAPSFSMPYAPGESFILIWRRELTRAELWQKMPDIYRKVGLDPNTLPPLEIAENDQTLFSGVFNAARLPDFAATLSKAIQTNQSQTQGVQHYLRVPSYYKASDTVASFAEELTKDLDMDVVYSQSLGEVVLPQIVFSGGTWEELLSELGFAWELEHTAGRTQLVLVSYKEVNP